MQMRIAMQAGSAFCLPYGLPVPATEPVISARKKKETPQCCEVIFWAKRLLDPWQILQIAPRLHAHLPACLPVFCSAARSPSCPLYSLLFASPIRIHFSAVTCTAQTVLSDLQLNDQDECE